MPYCCLIDNTLVFATVVLEVRPPAHCRASTHYFSEISRLILARDIGRGIVRAFGGWGAERDDQDPCRRDLLPTTHTERAPHHQGEEREERAHPAVLANRAAGPRPGELQEGHCWNIGIDRDEDSELID